MNIYKRERLLKVVIYSRQRKLVNWYCALHSAAAAVAATVPLIGGAPGATLCLVPGNGDGNSGK